VALTSVTLEIVMRLSVVVVLAIGGCGFEHGLLLKPDGSAGGGSGEPMPDAPVVVVDASKLIDAPAAMIDAPCPDGDADGICDSADDWPCGTKPTAPSASIMFSGNSGQTDTTVWNVNLDSAGRLAVAAPQLNAPLTFNYSITDTACPANCIDQLEIGWVPGGRSGCVFDGQVSKAGGESGNASVTIRTPATPGVYDLRVNLGQNFSCNYQGATAWWGGTPATSRTIAKLCVH
jgi:hypothetical protein